MDSPDEMALKAYFIGLVDAYKKAKINEKTLEVAADLFVGYVLEETKLKAGTTEMVDTEKLADNALNSATHFASAAVRWGKF